MSSPCVIGVDGGGSKTLALVAGQDGPPLGRGVAGSSNFHAVGAAAAQTALALAIDQALTQAGLAPQTVKAMCVGLSGVDRPHERAQFTDWGQAQFPGAAVHIANDAELVLAAGTAEGWGVALICGTGSIVYGRGAQDRLARAGGWGHLLGDEGSGYAIGMAALHAILRAFDGRAPLTALHETVLQQWRLASPTDLLQRIYQEHAAKAEIAALAPLVEAVAATGDTVAEAILTEAANELALAVVAVVQRLGLGRTVPCALAGGLMVGSLTLQTRLLAAVARHGLTLEPVVPVAEPAQGALRLARAAVEAASTAGGRPGTAHLSIDLPSV